MQHPNQRCGKVGSQDKDAAKCTWWAAAMLLYEACMAVSLWLVIKVGPTANS
jgi:hypothetical protein